MPDTLLLELQAQGLGPIDDARLEFAPGFNVLTGETGAGKTLLIGALSLCLGAGDDRGVTASRPMRASALFHSSGEDVAFVRESGVTGRLRGSIDALATSAKALRERSSNLIVIHGQHDSLRLRDRAASLRLVDDFGRIDDTTLRRVRGLIRDLLTQRDELGGDETSRTREIEFLRFQVSEIDTIAPTSVNELRDGLERLQLVTALRDHHDELLTAIQLIDGDDDALLDQLSRASKRVPPEGRLGEIRERLESATDDIRELVRELTTEAEAWNLDESELAQLEARVTVLQNLARKYGGSLDGVFREWSTMEGELAKLVGAAETVRDLDDQLVEMLQQESQLAAEIRALRLDAAHRLAHAVQGQFSRVALAGARFDILVSGDDGSHVELHFAPNEHVSPGPVQALASGGELARVLLAISLETVSDGVVAVFDEIDAGIGGSVAQQIGECLKELSRRQQVIVVTHLASVAAKADRHFVVSSQTREGRAWATVEVVDGDDRVSEIARMLAGESQLHESRALAQRLLGGP